MKNQLIRKMLKIILWSGLGSMLFYLAIRPIDAGSALRAREAALEASLFTLRETIKQYRMDMGSGPSTLNDLVTAGYLRRIPADPMTGISDLWIIYYRPKIAGYPLQIVNVRSGAKGKGPSGVLSFDR